MNAIIAAREPADHADDWALRCFNMRTFEQLLTLLLVCGRISALAAEAEPDAIGKLEHKVSATNGIRNQVIITEAYSRNGDTNLVRYIKVEDGKIGSLVQQVFYAGRKVLGAVRASSSLSIIQEPNIPFRVIFEFASDGKMKLIGLFDKNGKMVEAFKIDDFVLHPASAQELDAANKTGAELGSLLDPEEVKKDGWLEKVDEYIKKKSEDQPE